MSSDNYNAYEFYEHMRKVIKVIIVVPLKDLADHNFIRQRV